MEYYSLKMRASQQVGEGEQKHEQHISGAERIVGRNSVEAVCSAMVRRAMTHSKGDPDFINVKIEKVCECDIQILKALPVTRIDVDTWQEGLEKAFGLVSKAVMDVHKECSLSVPKGGMDRSGLFLVVPRLRRKFARTFAGDVPDAWCDAVRYRNGRTSGTGPRTRRACNLYGRASFERSGWLQESF